MEPFSKAAGGTNESVNINGKIDERTSLLPDGAPRADGAIGADAKQSELDGSDEV